MGRRSLALLILLAGAGPAHDIPLRAARWIAPDRDAVALLSSEPSECLRLPKEPGQALSVEIGRAAFRDPLLLGGQAARQGLSCNSCHRSGRGNPDFVFPGLSGAPGTADVTSSLMSSHRGDGVDNPKPIPDLSGPRERLRVRQGVDGFVHGLIAQEFDGADPPPRVVAGLVAYVGALAPVNCPKDASVPTTLAARLDDVRRAVRAADGALFLGDAAAARSMLSAARSMLGGLDERYAGDGLSEHRAAIRIASLALAAIPLAKPDEAHARIAAWLASEPGWTEPLGRYEARSLFNPVRLRATVSRSDPAR